MNEYPILTNLPQLVRDAVAYYWTTRNSQQNRQTQVGRSDRGFRSAVTGGAQMNGFIELFYQLALATGIDRSNIFSRTTLELPGFFRPSKEWDFLIVKNNELILALEAKSQAGPSFGNNFNNRTEEAMGSALDLWTAFREGAFNSSTQPFLGYFFMLEDCPASQKSVQVREPHFNVFPEFKNASYAKRYELFCRKLVRERHYTASAFITSQRSAEIDGSYHEPARDLTISGFARSIVSHIAAYT